jgi:hypothetical protein
MFEPRNPPGLPRRRLPSGVVLLAMLAAASLPVGVASALGAFDGAANSDSEDPYAAGHGPHEGGYNANRQAIGGGDSVLGEYTMYSSSGPEGTCVEIEFPDRNPPGGGRAFYSDCSSETNSALNAATVTAGDGAVVYGLVPEQTSRVEIDRVGARDLAATLRPGHAGDDRGFFVESTADSDVEGTIRAIGADDRQIETRPVP